MAQQQVLQQQQVLMRALRTFVDALRDIKKEEDVDANVDAAARALCDSVSNSDDASRTPQTIDAERVWRAGLVPAIQQLGACMQQIDQLEKEREAATPTPPKAGARPVAPLGLLSLRDYSVLQAALEIVFSWAAYPRVEAGILLPIDKRRPTRTLDIAKFVLQHNSERVAVTAAAGRDLLAVTHTMLQLLFLPQFQPVLLPKYVVELVALLAFGESCAKFDDETRSECARLRHMVLRALPLRLSMTSLRAALGQTTASAGAPTLHAFKQLCGELLSQLLMEPGGVMTTIEMLLGAVEEGNTQARVQVATLICQCPSSVAPDAYARALSLQVKELLSPAYRSSKLLCETAVLVADKLAGQHPDVFATEFVAQLFDPLLLLDDTRRDAALVASEAQVLESVTLATLLICGPPPSQHLLQALAPVVRPMLQMYSFAVASRSELAGILRVTLVAWIKMCHGAAVVLQLAVLPVVPPLPPLVLAAGGYRRDCAAKWTPLRKFCAGGSGGVALQIVDGSSADSSDALAADAQLSLQMLVVAMAELLCAKELESCEVVGELFASLLLTYMHVRRKTQAVGGINTSSASRVADTQHSDADVVAPYDALRLYEDAKVPTDASGVELILTLLLAIIESLGPSVLRSAGAILSCIATVLETYNDPKTRVIDKTGSGGDEHEAPPTSSLLIQEVRDTSSGSNADADTSEDDDDGEGDEILTICLGVVMTILEAGATTRSAAEEQQLRAMLPVLEVLSQHPRPEVAELASNVRVQILVRGGAGSSDRRTSCGSAARVFDDVLREAQDDLSSALVPLRARGVVALTKLVRQSQQERHDPAWAPRIAQLVRIFLAHLDDAESYVFLAAVQGLATLADAHPDAAIPLLVRALCDRTQSLERRIKLSEALLFAAKRCGETLPKYAKVFVFAYLECIRPPRGAQTRAQASPKFQLIQEVGSSNDTNASVGDDDSDEQLVEATLRASCLSNLAEVCVLLQWSLQPFLVDVMTCVFGILQLELHRGGSGNGNGNGAAAAASVTAVRRGAVFVLKYVVQLMGGKVLEVMPEQLKPMYHTLKVVARTDTDAVVVFHARQALAALDGVMRAELFPARAGQDSAFGIASLRIVR